VNAQLEAEFLRCLARELIGAGRVASDYDSGPLEQRSLGVTPQLNLSEHSLAVGPVAAPDECDPPHALPYTATRVYHRGMDIVQIGIATATALVALYWWRRIARFMDTVENRIRDIDDKLTRRDD
jgi:hypothetical protein